MSAHTQALTPLLRALKQRNYHFITPTPATHRRVVARKQEAQDLRDVFGWSLPFTPELLDADLVALLRDADLIDQNRVRIRVSSLGDDLYAHSAFPTASADSVFFGPDTYRFAAFLREQLPRLGQRRHVVDYGAGTGAGAVTAARIARAKTTLLDINPAALDLARANCAAAEVEAAVALGQSLASVESEIDLIVANPPYIADPGGPKYRDGGAMHGGAISLAWAQDAATHLAPGGALALYTGSAIVGGKDELKTALFDALPGFDISYRELDPDVFGEELEREDYSGVERIAVVGLIAIKR